MRTRDAGTPRPPTDPSPVGLELRIHGVHGTTPEAMLGVPSVVQVAGDGLTGVFRSEDGEVPYRDLGSGPVVEAYSWGKLTSGVGGAFGWLKRALWLLLLPFSLANLAYWARLKLGEQGGQARYGVVAVRWSSLLLTVFFLLTACLVSVDLFAWQCYRAGIPACPAVPGWFSGMAQLTPGRRLAIGVLGPTFVVALLYVLSGTSLARYEATRDPSGEHMEREREKDVGGTSILRHPNLWRGTARTTALRNVHIAAAMATIVLFVATHVWLTRRETDTVTRLVAVAGVLAGLELLAAAGFVATPLRGDVEVDLDARWTGRLTSRALMASAAGTLLLLEVLLVLQPSADYGEFRDYYGDNASLIAVFVLLTILHLSVFTSERLQHTLVPDPGAPLARAGHRWRHAVRVHVLPRRAVAARVDRLDGGRRHRGLLRRAHGLALLRHPVAEHFDRLERRRILGPAGRGCVDRLAVHDGCGDRGRQLPQRRPERVAQLRTSTQGAATGGPQPQPRRPHGGRRHHRGPGRCAGPAQGPPDPAGHDHGGLGARDAGARPDRAFRGRRPHRR